MKMLAIIKLNGYTPQVKSFAQNIFKSFAQNIFNTTIKYMVPSKNLIVVRLINQIKIIIVHKIQKPAQGSEGVRLPILVLGGTTRKQPTWRVLKSSKCPLAASKLQPRGGDRQKVCMTWLKCSRRHGQQSGRGEEDLGEDGV